MSCFRRVRALAASDPGGGSPRFEPGDERGTWGTRKSQVTPFSRQADMKRPFHLAFLGICAAGFLAGFGAKRWISGSAESEGASAAAASARSRHADERPERPRPERRISTAGPWEKSTDTLESLLATPDHRVYARLAVWLMDANAEDIAAYWDAYHPRESRSIEVGELIFMHWTRLDPLGALAATEGTPDEGFAWWAWGGHDPAAALARAHSHRPDHLARVVAGIGEIRGRWARENFDLIPEANRWFFAANLTARDNAADPEEILDFLRERNLSNPNFNFDSRMFRALVRRDPWRALEWLDRHGPAVALSRGGLEQMTNGFVRVLIDSQPELLEQIAAQSRSPHVRRRIEDALFARQAGEDPHAALAIVREERAPRTAATRLAAVGSEVVHRDPELALEVFGEMFERVPDPFNGRVAIWSPTGSSATVSSIPSTRELANRLMAIDPEATLDRAESIVGWKSSATQHLARDWMGRDIAGFSEWVDRMEDPEERKSGVTILIHGLRSQNLFPEAAERALEMSEEPRHLQSVFESWAERSPDDALDWLEASSLTEEQKGDILLRRHQTRVF